MVDTQFVCPQVPQARTLVLAKQLCLGIESGLYFNFLLQSTESHKYDEGCGLPASGLYRLSEKDKTST